MTRSIRQIGSLVTFASLVIMLCIQTLHSPLNHIRGCCEVSSQQRGECTHTHSHGQHDHSHAEHSPAEHKTDSHNEKAPSCPHEDCQLCQFLAQHYFETQLPITLDGGECVEIYSEQTSPLFVEPIDLSFCVRGPPMA